MDIAGAELDEFARGSMIENVRLSRPDVVDGTHPEATRLISVDVEPAVFDIARGTDVRVLTHRALVHDLCSFIDTRDLSARLDVERVLAGAALWDVVDDAVLAERRVLLSHDGLRRKVVNAALTLAWRESGQIGATDLIEDSEFPRPRADLR
ncbi:hypothetical protein Xcel_0238 [Xylanimonas cellulosilytica DSM 15894]|uniref:Uncharacterized protein n=1 Tax=Xylanimonas cellulosilytica (strain DSM 15894 / JCM 12276 / CECT 5975 / KCTC 9989 / LMG 20990 / NBRC 107835 / XIL07) TaxID=446471 RepID=D1BUN6_XYLCX|nr:hypothetical protein [Xylanimonas cellulosilytica]ACZ29277.1 hypothetical protein Xcel_0238 [Xylanimonas cellulosilytica DSM 15894]